MACRQLVFFLLCLACWFHQQRKAKHDELVSDLVTFKLIGKRGRLGNQLFQVASTIGIAESNGRRWVFPEEISETRVGKLFNLQGSAELRDVEVVEVKEKNETQHHLVLPKRMPGKAISLHGYFQNWQSFKSSFDSVEGYLQLSADSLEAVLDVVPEVALPNSLTIHVRRGDYVTGKYKELYVDLPLQYYISAVHMMEKVDVIVIVSDDIVWCKSKFSQAFPFRTIFSPFEDELSDFLLLHLGRNIIIANSSFSWWAAFLKVLYNKSQGGVIVAPNIWYRPDGDLAHLNRDSFYPPSWKLVNVSAL